MTIGLRRERFARVLRLGGGAHDDPADVDLQRLGERPPIKVFAPKFQPLGTVENAGATQVLAPHVTDPHAYDAKIQAALKLGAERRGAAS